MVEKLWMRPEREVAYADHREYSDGSGVTSSWQNARTFNNAWNHYWYWFPTKEERIRIVQEGMNQCGGACDFCNGCDNLGGGSVDAFYEPYINGEKELRELNEEYRSNSGLVK